MRRALPRLVLIGSMIALGCASGGGGGDDAGGVHDGAPRDSGHRDAGHRDGGHDAGPIRPDSGFCGGVICELFQYCDVDRCRDYPACAGDGTCPRPGDVCRSRRCVPGTADPDGDGSPASQDCDETNPNINPGHPEVCNNIDDNCNSAIDEGDPATLCESDPVGGVCMAGVCGCPPNTYDIDRGVPGCECNGGTPFDQGLSCDAALDLGDIPDDGTSVTQTGNVLPAGRETWYRFNGVDMADDTCDNYYVRVQFLTNPGDAYELMVFRGDCATAACAEGGYTDFRWATDFRSTIADQLTGQCPCWLPSGTPVDNVSPCQDDSAQYLVRVRRRDGAAVSCDAYTIEFSNGAYDS